MNTNVAQKQQKEQDLTPQEQFTGKNLTRFGGAGLLRINDYRLRTGFSDGAIKDVDLVGESRGEIFEPFKELGFFLKVFVNPDTRSTEWPNGAAFAPEFLYETGVEIKKHTEENLSNDFKKQLFQAEKPFNMFRKPIVNFSMPWNWLLLPCHWIAINIMPGTVTI